MLYPFPGPLREKLEDFSSAAKNKFPFANLALWSERFVRWHMEENGKRVKKIDDGSREYEFIQQVSWDSYKDLLEAYHKRMERLVRARGGKIFVYTLRSRMVIGLGGADVREVGFTFHRMGFPYVPASSLKGLARAAALLLCHSSQEAVDALLGASVAEEGQAGQVIFLDAVPCPPPKNKALLEVDILNPHYPKYYQTEGEEVPGEWQDPVPIFFLAVPRGTKFCFGVIGEEAKVQRVWAWLERGLRELGVGAKTTLGYGLWWAEREPQEGGQHALSEETAKPDQKEAFPSEATALTPLHKVRPRARLHARILTGAADRQGLWVQLQVEGLLDQKVFCQGVASSLRHEGLIEVEVIQKEPEIRVKFIRRLP